ncbi:phage tail protein [Achromobacter sp. LC458]|uniref:phage tail protein n=1 Tax=Achromobacter sp. LC458 TaxID=1120623 RepID=UPI0011685FC2|nr:phage tail protein [Achromobacter sp. LC458]TRM51468.1 phage tail protein [Achromobacter sp. LC458]
MSSIFINGTRYAISTALAAAVPITAITNAKPAVASAATPPADESILVLKSAWTNLNETVARSANADADSFELEGVDTTSTVLYPAAGGAGSFQAVTSWVELDQVRDVVMAGGDQQFFNYQYVEDPTSRQRQKPTFKNAMTMTVSLDYDPDKPWYAALIEADRLREPVVVRGVLPNGSTLFYYAYPSFNKVPVGQVNENLQNTAVFSLIADPIRYEAA